MQARSHAIDLSKSAAALFFGPNSRADGFGTSNGIDTNASTGYTLSNGVVTNVKSTAETTESLPAMTSNTAPSGVASASSIYSTAYDAWMAFDQNNNTLWSAAGACPQWLQRQTANIITVQKYYLTARSDSSTAAPTSFNLAGSMDGASWTVVDTQTGQSIGQGATATYTLSSPQSYKYWRLNMVANPANNPGLAEFGLLQSAGNQAMTVAETVAAQKPAAPPVKANIHFRAKVISGALNLNTNLFASATRDGGTTWTNFVLTAVGLLENGYTAFEALGLDISGTPSGTDFRTRVQTDTSIGVNVLGLYHEFS